MVLKLNPAQDGLRKVLKIHEQEALRFIWRINRVGDETATTVTPKFKPIGSSSRDVWEGVNDSPAIESISRATIINFLNEMVDEEVLDYSEITGKGGHRGIYKPILDEKGFIEKIIRDTICSFNDSWPFVAQAEIEKQLQHIQRGEIITA